MSTNNDCFRCRQTNKKHKSSIICAGCQKPFCNKCYQEHRNSLQKDFDGLIEQHNTMRENLYNDNEKENSLMSQLLKKIDDWEKEMIQNIKITATTTKTRLMQMINEEKNELKKNFRVMADELKTNQSSSDYVETDIQEWQRQLSECTQKLEQLQTSKNDLIAIDIKTLDWKNSIGIQRRKDVRLRTKLRSINTLNSARQRSRRNCSWCSESFVEGTGDGTSDFCSIRCHEEFDENDDNVCFHGNCVVSLANELTKLVKDICRGDILQSTDGSAATIVYVVKIVCKNKRASMVSLDKGLIITPWHPIRINDKWTFPHDIGVEMEIECEAVYNFVLDVGHTIVVNGTQCVTLGHGFKGDVIAHPYYGTAKVLEDLRAVDRLNTGYIELLPNSIIRDKKTGLVCGIRRYNTNSLDEHLDNLNTRV